MKKIQKLINGIDRTLWLTLGLSALLFILLHDLLGSDIFGHSWWDSYTLQALAWRNGSLGLGQNYEYLELAYYNGDWFVSFPPVPSLLMLPLTYIFGLNTPNNFVVMLLALVSIYFVYKLLRSFGINEYASAFFASVAVLGSNMLWMCTNGGVWFMAQACCFALVSAAVYAAVCGKRLLANALIAFAVGCRPFTLIWYFFFIAYYAKEDLAKENKGLGNIGIKELIRTVLPQWKLYIIPALIGTAYMAYNYARFDNPFEFGHNYLPEFQFDSQFSFSYIFSNLVNILLRPVLLDGNLHLQYTRFNGFMMYIANPIYLIYLICLIRDLRSKKISQNGLVISLLLVLNIILLSAHRTMGGWQFGARYTTDMIPFVMFYLAQTKNGKDEIFLEKPGRWAYAIGIFALLFNIYGTLAMSFIEAAA